MTLKEKQEFIKQYILNRISPAKNSWFYIPEAMVREAMLVCSEIENQTE